MSLDARIETLTRPMLGCHSDLDKYKTSVPPCSVENRNNEKACMWCERLKVGTGDTAPEGHNAPHEGPGAASSRTVPLDAVVGRQTEE